MVLLAHRSSRIGSETAERRLQSVPGLSIGLISTAQGPYTQVQMLRDLNLVAMQAAAASMPGRLRVARLPQTPAGYAHLRGLVRSRAASEMVLIVELASAANAHELRWAALAGLGPGGETLTSQSTQQRGLIAAIDLVPTVLVHLHLPIPAAMRGKPIHLDGELDGTALRSLKARLEVVYPRRLPALACLLGAWVLVLLAGLLARRAGRRVGDGPLRWGLRVGALALLWTPVAALVPAAIEPSAAVEYALIVAICFALAALSDALLRWPRAPIAPAAAALLALSADALAGTQLLMRSLLGPNPAYGARFYGIGNELKPGLAVLGLVAVAAALYPSPARSRRGAAAMAGAGALLALVEGSARIGAGVGGVVLVCAGAAVAAGMLLPGASARRRVLAVAAAPLVGLLLLAAVDLASARGAGHFTGSVLHARSAADLQDLIVRRDSAAWRELRNGLMPLATAIALALAALGVARHRRLLSAVGSDPAWRAALAGGLTAGIVGALCEDSGPVLLVVAVSALACVLAYLWGCPDRPVRPGSSRSRGAIAALPPQHDLVL